MTSRRLLLLAAPPRPGGNPNLARRQTARFGAPAILVRGRQELAPRVRETFERLHTEAERAIAENLAARGWEIRAEPAAEARGFWAAILGVALEGATGSKPFEPASAEATVDLVARCSTPRSSAPADPRATRASHLRTAAPVLTTGPRRRARVLR
jgi:hypothetical protein